MRKTLLILGAAAVIGAPNLVPSAAHADCHDRKVAGTVIGAVAGGLLGNAVAHGGGRFGGTLIGAGVGGLAGHEIAGAGCRRYYHHVRYDHRTRAEDRYAAGRPGAPPPTRCATQEQSFYDERGQLVQRPTQVCQ